MNPTRLTIAEFLRPIQSWAPRGYAYVYKWLLGPKFAGRGGDAELKQKLVRRYRVFHDRNLGAYVCADLGDWASRAHYYRGVYYDRTTPLLIDRFLAGGGTFLDVGANRGLHTLYAARVLAGRGEVHAFEPNPDTFEVLKAHLVMNQVGNCTPLNIGIAATGGELQLNLFGDDHSGACSFVAWKEVARTVSVPTRPLDEVVDADSLRGPVFVKIDVEGYEHEVLKGMRRLLSRPDVAVLCELTAHWLSLTGSSVDAVLADMASQGYRMLLPRVRHRRLIEQVVDLEAAGPPSGALQFDGLFVR